jgi:hypothetical protein
LRSLAAGSAWPFALRQERRWRYWKKLQPDFSLQWVENYRREEDRRRWTEGFRLAGLE